MNIDKIQIDKFDGSDFGFWRLQILGYLAGKDLDEALGDKPEAMKDEDWKRINKRALGIIHLSLSRNVAFHTTDAKTAKEAMDILANMFEKPSAANKVHLIRKLFNLKMSESTGAANHLNELNLIMTQLASVGIIFDDEVKALTLLSSLPHNWEGIVAAVSASTGKEKLVFDTIKNMVLSEETRRKQAGFSSGSGSALNTESRGRFKNRGRSRGRDRSKSRGREATTSGQKETKRVVCWNCDKPGHFSRQCTAPRRNQKQASANVTEEISDALILSVSSPLESWVLDSGASFHSCSDSSIMESYTSGDFGVVYLADDEPLKIVGKGDVKIKNPNSAEWKLSDVRHIPGLKRNLISVGQLDSKEYTTTFSSNSWKITKGAMMVARGQKEGTLYLTKNICNIIDNVGIQDDAVIWHSRLGHMSEKGMKVLHSKGLLPGMKHVDVGFCEDCILGKQRKVSFSTAGREAKKEKLELVHTDLWGPAPVTSLGGASYYMTFIDDSTRKVWVYFLKRKSDAFITFRNWKTLVENETGLKVKCLRSDNGGEYELDEFKKYCAEHGIRMEKTVPDTPQQNGVAERMNRTLNEHARCMRLKCGLPLMF